MLQHSFYKYFNKNKVLIGLFLFSILGYLSNYLFNVILSNYLTPARYGEFNIAIRVLGILTSLTLLGTNASSKRFLARFLNLHEESNLEQYIQWNLRMIRISFLLCVALAIAAYGILHLLHIWQFKNIRTYHMAIYMFWVAPLAALSTLLSSYLLCANYTLLSNFLNNIQPVIYVLLFVFVVMFFNITFRSTSLSLLLMCAFVLLICIELFFITQHIPKLFTHMLVAFEFKKNRDTHSDWLKVSLRMAVNNLLYLIICASDLMIVQLVSENKNEVGFYAVAFTIAAAVLVIPQNLYVPLKTKISQLVDSAKGKQELVRELKQLNRYTLFFILLVGGGILIFSKPLLFHFGSDYLQANSSLVILTLGYMAAAYAPAASMVIAYSGNEKRLLDITLIELGFLIIVGVILTYFWGYTGTALATSLTFFLKTLMFHIETYRKLGIATFVL